MSRTIDERVVSMQFDNRQFESNVRTTMSTLDKLKQSLNLQGASKGLENVNAAANSCNMSGLSGAVETVRAKFSALEVMAVTALANITNSAVNAGKRLVSAFTIEPIKTGLAEYETQINAVQTILANTQSKGTTLKDVNGALDELNTYADKTIYNFTEMSRNIGTFTAAGVDLDTSVSAIKGIANLAAVSGSNSQQASTAMYQLSQALAAGTVKLMDWNSVVNAGMGGQVFQDALKETARVHGINIDAMIKKEGSFRETLQNGWLSSEILTETLAKFTGDLTDEQLRSMGYTEEQITEIQKLGKTANDAATKVKTFTQLMDTLKEAAQSGWTQTWEILIGDFEEAKELWTSVSDVFGGMIASSAEARNKMLQGWADGGGRTMAIEALKNTFEGLMSVIKPIGQAFREIFPRTTSEQLIKITKAIRDFTEKLKLSDENSARLKSTFKGLFSVIDIGVTFIKEIVVGIAKLIGNFTGLGGGILGVTGSIGDFLSGMRDSIKETDLFGRAIDAIVGFIQNGIDKIKEFTSSVKEKISAPGFEGFLGVMMGIWEAAKKVGSAIVDVASNIGRAIGSVFQNGSADTLLDVLNGGIIATILLNIKKWVKGVTESFDGSIKLMDQIKDVLNSVKDSLTAWQENLKANVLLKLAAAIGILALALVVIATIDPKKLAASLGAITVLFVDLVGAIAIFDKIDGSYKGAAKAATMMVGMSVAVLILAGAMKKIADLEWEEIAKGLVGVLGLTAILVAAAKVMSSESKQVISGATQMVIMAASLKIMASVCNDLAKLSWSELAKGLAGVGVLMAELGIFMKNAKFSGNAMSTAAGVVILAAGIKILASACGDFASMKWEQIGKGLASVAGLLLEIAVFTKLTANATNVISTGIALIAISASMKIFAEAVGTMSKMSWTEIAKGLTAMAGSLLAVTLALRFIGPDVLAKSVGLIGVAAAITILGNALISVSKLSWNGIAKGLVAVGGSMAILATGLNFMTGTLAGSAALLVAAGAFSIFAPVLKTLGSMSLGSIGKSLLALAGVLTVLGLAGLILAPLIPTLYALSGAIVLFGVGCALAGGGILALSIGLATLGASLVVAAGSIVEVLTTLLRGLGDIIVATCDAIANSADSIAKAIVAVIVAVCKTLKESLPVIVDTFFQLLVDCLVSLKTYIPQLVDLLVDVLVGLMDALATRMPELVNSAVNLIGKFFSALNDALGQGGLENLLKSLKSVALIFVALGLTAKIVSTIPITGALTGIAGLAIVIAGIAGILAALGGLAQIPGFEWIIGEGAKVLGQIGTAIGTFVGNIVGSFATGLTNALPQIGKNLGDFMTNAKPFVDGIKNVDASVLSGVANIAGAVLILTGTDVITGLTSWLTGGSSLVSFGKELAEFGPYFKKYADSISGIDPSAVASSAVAAKALSALASSLPNSGGMISWFVGENSIASFGEELVTFGTSLKSYANSVAGIDAESVTASAKAAKALAEMANIIPNEGGMVAWFTGDNSVASFGEELVTFGDSLKAYSQSVAGVDSEAIVASANASKALAQMADTIPNEGGMAAWFTGDNSIASFGYRLVAFGASLKEYSENVVGIDVEAVKASAMAGKALAQMADTIPNEGGMVAWFTGDNSIASFGTQIAAFGASLKAYSDNVTGIDIEAVKASAIAGKALAQMADTVPNEGGMIAWFAGENSLASFGEGIKSFGKAMKSYSESVTGIDVEAVKASATAGKTLAQMAETVPNEGGMAAWFSGENSLSSFSEGIKSFGKAMKAFSESVTGIDVEAVKAAATAGKTLAEMADTVPNEGGMAAWFAGENSLSSFSEGIKTFGGAMKSFSDKVVGIDVEAVKAASTAGKTLAEMASIIPNQGGIAAWFAGENSLASFSEEIITFGGAMKAFSNKVAGIDAESVKAATSAGKTLAEMANTIPSSGGIAAWFSGENSMASFSEGIVKFGGAMKSFSNKVAGLDATSVKAAATAGKTLAEMTNTIPESVNLSSFGDQIEKFGENIKKFAAEVAEIKASELNSIVNNLKKTIDSLVKIAENGTTEFSDAFKNGKSKVTKAVSDLIEAIKDSVKSKESSVSNAFEKIAKSALKAVKNFGLYNDFYNAGGNLVSGFANGITANTYKAEAKAKAMASAAYQAAKEQLDINSPSKVFRKLGFSVPEGFAMGIDKLGNVVRDSASSMADTAIGTTKDALSNILNVINNDVDAQPSIRPVLDLTDITSGAREIDGLFSMQPSVGVMSNIGAISTMMNRGQNGVNDDVISAIRDLGRKIGESSGNTYNVNGVTYDDGSNVSDAIRTLVRAARVERRS